MNYKKKMNFLTKVNFLFFQSNDFSKMLFSLAFFVVELQALLINKDVLVYKSDFNVFLIEIN